MPSAELLALATRRAGQSPHSRVRLPPSGLIRCCGQCRRHSSECSSCTGLATIAAMRAGSTVALHKASSEAIARSQGTIRNAVWMSRFSCARTVSIARRWPVFRPAMPAAKSMYSLPPSSSSAAFPACRAWMLHMTITLPGMAVPRRCCGGKLIIFEFLDKNVITKIIIRDTFIS